MAENKNTQQIEADDPRSFLLGKIFAKTEEFASRFDRFEVQLLTQFRDMKTEMNANLSGLNSRVAALEQASSNRGGMLSTLTATVTVIATVVSSVLSSLITYFLGKH